jgi:son of sevenless
VKLLERLKFRRQVTYAVHGLKSKERARVEWLFPHYGNIEPALVHALGYPLSLSKHLTSFIADWEATYPNLSQNDQLCRLITRMNTNRGIFEQAEETCESMGAAYLVDAIGRYGFTDWKMQSEYLFDLPDRPDNIVTENRDGRYHIRCASMEKLVERVTHEQHVDLTTRFVFLLTYRSFTTAEELLELLAARYFVPVPDNLSHQEIQRFKAQRLDRIQIRVCAVLKNWMEEHFSDFEENPQLCVRLQELLDEMVVFSASKLSRQLARALRRLLLRQGKKDRSGFIRNMPHPAPIMDEKIDASAPVVIQNVHPLEIARQLTLLDFDIFSKIAPRECLNKRWSGESATTQASNIKAMSEQFQQISKWVQWEILQFENIQQRATMIKFFLDVAQHCFEMNNYNSLNAIYCAMEASSVFRLKRTKELLPVKYERRMEEFSALFRSTGNWNALREALVLSMPPCIPYLGIFLQDLTFIEDGNKDFLRGMINFDKRFKLAERIRWIKQYQQSGYNLQAVPHLQQHLRERLSQEYVSEDLYEQSLRVEPREPAPE